MCTVGMYLGLHSLNKLDLTKLQYGNPGIGGTDYCQLFVAQQFLKDNKVVIYTRELLNIDKRFVQVVVEDELESIKRANKEVDVFIWVAKFPIAELYREINNSKLRVIAWVHNYINYKTIKLLRDTKNIKRVVFVGQQHYDSYIDDKLIEKSTFIYNIVPFIKRPPRILDSKEKKVVYIGALAKSKGFHVLAKVWKSVIAVVPEAKLYVMGSVQLYDRTIKMGKFGIAKKEYEDLFMPYLLDKNNDIMDSVKFMGTVGVEKYDIFKSTYVGVPNPSGLTETFCLSAVELESCGVPIATYRGYGLLDTVKHGFTGLQSRNSKELADNIIKLLTSEEINKSFGDNAVEYVKKFDTEIIMPEWFKLVDDVLQDIPADNKFSHSNYFDDWKWLKYALYIVKRYTHLTFIPSVSYATSYAKSMIKDMIKKIRR